MSVDPGEGWRRLEVGERIEAGDEYRGFHGNWYGTARAGTPVTARDDTFRRRVPAATADAVRTSAGSVYEMVREFLRTLGLSIPLKTDTERQCSIVLTEAMYELARLRLTDAEREAIEVAAHWCETPVDPVYSQASLAAQMAAKTLRGLLERLKSPHNTRIYGSKEGER